jgi:hypothetical protein
LASNAQSAATAHLYAPVARPIASGSPFTPNNFVRVLVTLAFFVSLMQYWVDVNYAGLVPLASLFLAGFLVVLTRDRKNKMSQIFSGGSVLILFCVLSEVVSYFNGDPFSVQYGLVLILLFLVARLIILQIGMLEILRCYIYSAVFSSLIIIIVGRKQLGDYQGGNTRFTGGANAHPNLLGFTLASYFPLFIGFALDLPPGRKRLFIAALACVTFALLFTTGSRGSLGAVLLAALITAMRFTVLNPLIGKVRITLLQAMVSLLGLGALIYTLFHGNELAHITKFVVEALQLNSQYRGIHSGFSGRTNLWVGAINRLTGLEWLFGMGYRQGFLIDSGYITVLFDNGLLGGSVIVFSILRIFYWLWISTARIESAGWWRYHIVLWNLVIIYLVNNFTTRYLFSYGNQFSLLMIFMMVCQRSELLGRTQTRVVRRLQQAPVRLKDALPIR